MTSSLTETTNYSQASLFASPSFDEQLAAFWSEKLSDTNRPVTVTVDQIRDIRAVHGYAPDTHLTRADVDMFFAHPVHNYCLAMADNELWKLNIYIKYIPSVAHDIVYESACLYTRMWTAIRENFSDPEKSDANTRAYYRTIREQALNQALYAVRGAK